jgi:flagellin-like protein
MKIYKTILFLKKVYKYWVLANFMIKGNNKKALSPVITTVLLVLITIVLAVIVLVWARGFGGDIVVKAISPGGEEKEISSICKEDVIISVQNVGGKLYITNQGSITVYMIAVKLSNQAVSEVKKSAPINLYPGRATSVDIDLTGFSSGDQIQVIPVVLGKNQRTGENAEGLCDFEESIQITTV